MPRPDTFSVFPPAGRDSNPGLTAGSPGSKQGLHAVARGWCVDAARRVDRFARLGCTAVLAYLLLAGPEAVASAPGPAPGSDWVGSDTCRGCHRAAFDAWRGSHHDLAMQPANTATVLGDFDNASFAYAGLTSRFYRKNGAFLIETEGPDGKLTEYEVAYVFGVDPLQQYLIPFPGGRLQALGIAWDTRPEAQGGQRWFHLYPEEAIRAGDPLHWTGAYQNWNLQCAECHSTRLEKGYDPESGQYQTTWSELNVGCEACHGPGARHTALAEARALATAPDKGLTVDLGERGSWRYPENRAIARRLEPLGQSFQVEACGRCHARRGVLGDYVHGGSLADTHRVSLPRPPLYHVDGQILDEVYVYASFRQSKMYDAGVVCSNCHEPHSARLRAPGSGVCAQCHKPAAYDTVQHHHHAAGSPGADCVNCHMPSRTYMVIDPRRDHSMRIPRPEVSVALGTPNACNGCHEDRSAEWAVNTLRDWGVQPDDRSVRSARDFAMLRRGDRRGVPGLVELASRTTAPAIWRATALTELSGFADGGVLALAREASKASDPLLRVSAVEVIARLPAGQRFPYLQPLLDDPAQSVRLEVARALADFPMEQLSPERAGQVATLFDEYRSVLERHSDVPETRVQQGVFFTARGNWSGAETAYRDAIAKNPELLSAYLNLADLYRLLDRDLEGRAVLLRATEVAPEQGAVWHALGLLEVRTGDRDAALSYLARSAALESEGIRLRYVYGIALHDGGDTLQALDVLKPLLREAPENPELLIALASYSQAAGLHADARRYAAKLRKVRP